ncbi:type VI secretion system accessory protein TagJ [Acetobacter sp.]|jgi:type VI secretion system protein ImpE|uniref:type VI secretion system accessory protein TagJ n=1 Tax=Acetobacter sp. TaxID=440 RepID=UPI0025B81092|nr:type VI secretion system accessory protein TagJ [Acetobacter sp.]MCH4092638.1 SciE type virulence protein [Acetobacter sp.]MCI1299772.1 SciE type virulence protein [Acetobacter sp.]MCI1315348.1 SciE type virulence protein [Acetobacter sp.]
MTAESAASVSEAFRMGALEQATALAADAIKAAPTESRARFTFFEMLLFSNQTERADKVLDTLQAMDAKAGVYIAECRQLLRADVIRRQYWSSCREPEFVGDAEPSQLLCLRAQAELKAGDDVLAAKTAEEAEQVRAPAPGHVGTKAFADFRDVDDLCGGSLEVLTTTGRYFQIPFGRIESAEFQAAHCYRDLYWRRCQLSVRGGPDGVVYVPALYGGTVELAADSPDRGKLLTGQLTEWTEGPLVRGIGQKLFLAGDEGLPVLDIGTLTFGE